MKDKIVWDKVKFFIGGQEIDIKPSGVIRIDSIGGYYPESSILNEYFGVTKILKKDTKRILKFLYPSNIKKFRKIIKK